MKTSLTLLLSAATCSVAHGARLGLLRMSNLPASRADGAKPKMSEVNSALFDEDLQSSLHELFGRGLQEASLSMSFDPSPATPAPTPPASTAAPTSIDIVSETLPPTEDQSENNSNDDPTDPPSNEGDDTSSLTGNLGVVGSGAASASVNAAMVAMIVTLSIAAVAVVAAVVVHHQAKKKNASDRSHGSADSDFSSEVSLSGREET